MCREDTVLTPLYCRKCGKLIPADSLFCFACGAPQANTTPAASPSLATGLLPAGQMLHQRYRLLQQIGQGGMGAVYAAHDTQLADRLMAVKEMSTSRLKPQEVPQAVEQFRQEAHLLASLQHPNLPVIHEYFQENGRWYLIMSFIEGRTLQAVLDATPGQKLPVNEAVRIGLELCNVLDYLHTHNPQIIFRDLKPLNIMLTPKGHLYLIDFGIARHFKQNQALDTAYYYSAGYAPPEQYGRSQTNPRSDIYSLGATIHQLLSGHHPADHPFQFAPLQQIDPSLPEPLTQLIAQMLKMQEQDRPASVAEVKTQLINPSPSAATRNIPLPSTVPASTANRPASLSLTLAAKPEAIEVLQTLSGHTMEVLSLALSANGQVLASCSNDHTIKVWNTQTSKPISASILGNRITVTSVALSTDGQTLASGDSGTSVRLWNVQNDKLSQIRVLTGHQQAVSSVALSADGLTLASGDYSGEIKLWNAQTGQSLHNFYDSRYSLTSNIALSANGLIVAGGKSNGKTDLYNARTGRHIKAIQSHPNEAVNIALSADGQILATSSHDGTIKLWHIQTDKLLYTLTSSTKCLALSTDGRLLASASYGEGAITLWNTQTGKLIRTLTIPTGSVSSVALSANGLLLASGSSDGTIHVWGVKG